MRALAGKNTMKSMTVTFPLPGKWQVVTSPGNHVPSHYTNVLGMTYAFDFLVPTLPRGNAYAKITKLWYIYLQSYSRMHSDRDDRNEGNISRHRQKKPEQGLQSRPYDSIESCYLNGAKAPTP